MSKTLKAVGRNLPDPIKNRLRNTRDSLQRPRWGKSKSIRFLTSYNETLFEASGRQCLQNFRRFNPQWPITSYIEASTASVLKSLEAELKSEKFDYVLLDEQPLLGEFLHSARDVIPVSLGGEAPEEMFPGTGVTSEFWFRKHMARWFRKIVALDHAMQQSEGVLVWMDCDCYALKSMPQSVLESAFGNAGVFFMKGDRNATEAGVLGYDLDQPGVRELITAMKEHYMSGAFRSYHRWDDCFTFDHTTANRELPLCRDIGRKADDMGNILESTLLAPYLTHDKGLHSRKLNLVD